jgi:hypothetical protein
LHGTKFRVKFQVRRLQFRGGLRSPWGPTNDFTIPDARALISQPHLRGRCMSIIHCEPSHRVNQSLGDVLRISCKAIRDGIHNPHSTPTDPPRFRSDRSFHVNSSNFHSVQSIRILARHHSLKYGSSQGILMAIEVSNRSTLTPMNF